MSHRRKGKVAKLPREIRDVVNQMLLDGATYTKICAALAERGYRDFNEMNISHWKDGGHQDWAREQRQLEDMRLKREFALDMARENAGSRIHEASLHLAASQLYEVMSEFDLDRLKTLLADEPENYSRVVNALAKLSDSGLKFERYRSEVEERKRAALETISQAKADGPTAATIEKIERELRLMPA